jgi:Tfp pilus assembly protein PilW
MITFIRRIKSGRCRGPSHPSGSRDRAHRRTVRGFTLTEVLIAATLSSFVLAGVLSAFLMIARSGFAASSYSELETQTRRGLEIFGNDARKAADVRWNSAQSVTLSIVTASNATTSVTYAYDTDPSSATYRCFYRLIGDASSTQPRQVLIREVTPDFAFSRFKLDRDGTVDNAAVTDLETKQLQVTLRAARTANVAGSVSQTAISARYVLRNKRVTN